MASKRVNSFIVNVRFPLPDGTSVTRGIAENALTPSSAVNKINHWYEGKEYEIISVVSAYAER